MNFPETPPISDPSENPVSWQGATVCPGYRLLPGRLVRRVGKIVILQHRNLLFPPIFSLFTCARIYDVFVEKLLNRRFQSSGSDSVTCPATPKLSKFTCPLFIKYLRHFNNAH
jgi:hypothetical protein